MTDYPIRRAKHVGKKDRGMKKRGKVNCESVYILVRARAVTAVTES